MNPRRGRGSLRSSSREPSASSSPRRTAWRGGSSATRSSSGCQRSERRWRDRGARLGSRSAIVFGRLQQEPGIIGVGEHQGVRFVGDRFRRRMPYKARTAPSTRSDRLHEEWSAQAASAKRLRITRMKRPAQLVVDLDRGAPIDLAAAQSRPNVADEPHALFRGAMAPRSPGTR